MAEKTNGLENILVVEDTEEFAQNALKAYKGNNVLVAKTLQETSDYLAKNKFDYIVSDVQFPENEGEEPKDNSAAMIKLASQYLLPMVLVTRTGHHGYVDEYDIRDNVQRYIRILALNPANSYTLNREGIKNFRDLRNFWVQYYVPAYINDIKKLLSEVKTPEIYKQALENLKRVPQSEEDTSLINSLKRRRAFVSNQFEHRLRWKMTDNIHLRRKPNRRNK